MVRQWVEFYLVRIRMETVLDALSNDELQAVLKVTNNVMLHITFNVF